MRRVVDQKIKIIWNGYEGGLSGNESSDSVIPRENNVDVEGAFKLREKMVFMGKEEEKIRKLLTNLKVGIRKNERQIRKRKKAKGYGENNGSC